MNIIWHESKPERFRQRYSVPEKVQAYEYEFDTISFDGREVFLSGACLAADKRLHRICRTDGCGCDCHLELDFSEPGEVTEPPPLAEVLKAVMAPPQTGNFTDLLPETHNQADCQFCQYHVPARPAWQTGLIPPALDARELKLPGTAHVVPGAYLCLACEKGFCGKCSDKHEIGSSWSWCDCKDAGHDKAAMVEFLTTGGKPLSQGRHYAD